MSATAPAYVHASLAQADDMAEIISTISEQQG